MIICSQCGSTVEDGEQFCSECGARVGMATASQSPPFSPSVTQSTQGLSDQQTYTAASPLSSTPTAPKKQTNPIVWVAIPFGLLVVVILTVIGFSVSNSNNNSTSTQNTSSTTNSPSRTTSAPPGLPDSFQRSYQGTIGSKSTLSFSMSLTRSGRDLRGTASTGSKTDTLSGTIETDGRFRLEGYENGNTFSGIYSGQIYSDGTINGSWVNPRGRGESQFSLRQQ